MSEDTTPQARELEREARRLERVRLLAAVPDQDTVRQLPTSGAEDDPKEAA
jgi:hypothetical protein